MLQYKYTSVLLFFQENFFKMLYHSKGKGEKVWNIAGEKRAFFLDNSRLPGYIMKKYF